MSPKHSEMGLDIFAAVSIALSAVGFLNAIIVGEHRQSIASTDDTRFSIRLTVVPNEKSSSAPVLMMKSTDMRNCPNLSLFWRFN